jgi:predicted alpha/beta-hydrolase family hydrolase
MMQYQSEVDRLSKLIDEGIAALARSASEVAQAEFDYRKAKAIAWLEAPQGTVPVREAWVEAQTAELRRTLDMADGTRQASLEAVRSRRQQLSAVQSLLAAWKADQDFHRTRPQ